MTMRRKPKDGEAPEQEAIAPALEMEKEAVTMPDGKRRMIFFTFTEGKDRTHH